MSGISHEFDVKLKDGSVLSLSLFDAKLLFLNSDFICGQFDIDTTAIQVLDYPKATKIEFYIQGSGQSYQGWFAEKGQFKAIQKYFRVLGYPCPDVPMVGLG